MKKPYRNLTRYVNGRIVSESYHVDNKTNTAWQVAQNFADCEILALEDALKKSRTPHQMDDQWWNNRISLTSGKITWCWVINIKPGSHKL